MQALIAAIEAGEPKCELYLDVAEFFLMGSTLCYLVYYTWIVNSYVVLHEENKGQTLNEV